ncbi:MAG: MFS transporter [Brevinematales bacterium]|nr:MFS transporter [Brevinematales bacterium]
MSKLDLDRYFLRNTFAISLSEFLWGLGIPVILESNFVTVFLTYLGVNNFKIGLTNFVFSISMAIVPFFSAYLTSGMVYKKMANIFTQYIPSFSVILLGINFLFFYNPKYGYELFLFYFLLFSIGLASTVPVWQNYITKIFTQSKALKGISVMMFFQNTGKVIGGFLLGLFLIFVPLNVHNAGIIFLVTGILFFLGSTSFIFTVENPDEVDKSREKGFIKYYLFYLKKIFKNKNFVFYIIQDIEFTIVIVGFIFYSRYALEWGKIDMAQISGAFVILAFFGAIFANFLLGFLENIRLKSRYFLIKLSSIFAFLLLIFFRHIIGFYVVSFLLGFSRSGRIHLYIPVVKKLSGLNDASPYYAILPFVMLPVSATLPILAGTFLDKFSFMGDTAYNFLFVLMFLGVILSIIPFIKIDFDKSIDNDN